MGQIVKKVSENHSRYYWYPGEKREWIRAGIAVGAGAVMFAFALLVTRHAVPAVTAGAAVTAALAGFNFGRRDLRAAQAGWRAPPGAGSAGVAGSAGLAGAKGSGRGARRALVGQVARAGWRGAVQGLGAAFAAVLIANLPATGILADWLLPALPAAVGALAHQAGMAYERVAQTRMPADLPQIPAPAALDASTAPDASTARDATTVPMPPTTTP